MFILSFWAFQNVKREKFWGHILSLCLQKFLPTQQKPSQN